jgi:DNA-binding XRE family transcriptional regulator
MKAITAEVKEKVNKVFKALFEIDESIEDYKESIKAFRDSAKDLRKTLAEELDISEKSVNKAYKEYVFNIGNPEVASDSFYLLEILEKLKSKSIY